MSYSRLREYTAGTSQWMDGSQLLTRRWKNKSSLCDGWWMNGRPSCWPAAPLKGTQCFIMKLKCVIWCDWETFHASNGSVVHLTLRGFIQLQVQPLCLERKGSPRTFGWEEGIVVEWQVDWLVVYCSSVTDRLLSASREKGNNVRQPQTVPFHGIILAKWTLREQW